MFCINSNIMMECNLCLILHYYYLSANLLDYEASTVIIYYLRKCLYLTQRTSIHTNGPCSYKCLEMFLSAINLMRRDACLLTLGSGGVTISMERMTCILNVHINSIWAPGLSSRHVLLFLVIVGSQVPLSQLLYMNHITNS